MLDRAIFFEVLELEAVWGRRLSRTRFGLRTWALWFGLRGLGPCLVPALTETCAPEEGVSAKDIAVMKMAAWACLEIMAWRGNE